MIASKEALDAVDAWTKPTKAVELVKALTRTDFVPLATLLDAFTADAVKREMCQETFGSKGCALRAGHRCAHTSMSGSCWPVAVHP